LKWALREVVMALRGFGENKSVGEGEEEEG